MTEIAVIVPARDATGTLGRTLAALEATTFDRPFEVVVIDDASRDGTAELAERHGARVVRLAEQTGPAGARNAGLAATDAPLIAFTDADCEPTPGWLGALYEALRDADLVTGPVEPDPANPPGAFDRTLRLTRPSPRFETANLGVRRSVAERVGGFEAFAPMPGDERVGLRPRVEDGHFGEDALFGWRAVRAGARVAFAPGALVHHAVFPRRARGYVAERRRVRFFPTLVREVPEMRSRLPLRVFLSERTLLFDLALAALLAALARRRPWPLLLAAPYARRCLWRGPPWRRSVARINAGLVAGDVVTLAALVRGSVAARRLLL